MKRKKLVLLPFEKVLRSSSIFHQVGKNKVAYQKSASYVVVVQLITLSLTTGVEVELGCDNVNSIVRVGLKHTTWPLVCTVPCDLEFVLTGTFTFTVVLFCDLDLLIQKTTLRRLQVLAA